MDKRTAMRASDADRRAVIGRLGTALAEGRLDQQEHDRRLTRVGQSVTYGDLAGLYADLPAAGQGVEALGHVAPAALPAALRRRPSRFLPRWVRVLWTIWLTAFSIAVALWAMLSLSKDETDFFWPMWIAVPSAAGLLSLSVGSLLTRHERRADERRRILKAARRRSGRIR